MGREVHREFCPWMPNYGLLEDVLRKEYNFILPIDDETVVMDKEFAEL